MSHPWTSTSGSFDSARPGITWPPTRQVDLSEMATLIQLFGCTSHCPTWPRTSVLLCADLAMLLEPCLAGDFAMGSRAFVEGSVKTTNLSMSRQLPTDITQWFAQLSPWTFTQRSVAAPDAARWGLILPKPLWMSLGQCEGNISSSTTRHVPRWTKHSN